MTSNNKSNNNPSDKQDKEGLDGRIIHKAETDMFSVGLVLTLFLTLMATRACNKTNNGESTNTDKKDQHDNHTTSSQSNTNKDQGGTTPLESDTLMRPLDSTSNNLVKNPISPEDTLGKSGDIEEGFEIVKDTLQAQSGDIKEGFEIVEDTLQAPSGDSDMIKPEIEEGSQTSKDTLGKSGERHAKKSIKKKERKRNGLNVIKKIFNPNTKKGTQTSKDTLYDAHDKKE